MATATARWTAAQKDTMMTTMATGDDNDDDDDDGATTTMRGVADDAPGLVKPK